LQNNSNRPSIKTFICFVNYQNSESLNQPVPRNLGRVNPHGAFSSAHSSLPNGQFGLKIEEISGMLKLLGYKQLFRDEKQNAVQKPPGTFVTTSYRSAQNQFTDKP